MGLYVLVYIICSLYYALLHLNHINFIKSSRAVFKIPIFSKLLRIEENVTTLTVMYNNCLRSERIQISYRT